MVGVTGDGRVTLEAANLRRFAGGGCAKPGFSVGRDCGEADCAGFVDANVLDEAFSVTTQRRAVWGGGARLPSNEAFLAAIEGFIRCRVE